MKAMIKNKLEEENKANNEFEIEVSQRLKRREQEWNIKLQTA